MVQAERVRHGHHGELPPDFSPRRKSGQAPRRAAAAAAATTKAQQLVPLVVWEPRLGEGEAAGCADFAGRRGGGRPQAKRRAAARPPPRTEKARGRNNKVGRGAFTLFLTMRRPLVRHEPSDPGPRPPRGGGPQRGRLVPPAAAADLLVSLPPLPHSQRNQAHRNTVFLSVTKY